MCQSSRNSSAHPTCGFPKVNTEQGLAGGACRAQLMRTEHGKAREQTAVVGLPTGEGAWRQQQMGEEEGPEGLLGELCTVTAPRSWHPGATAYSLQPCPCPSPRKLPPSQQLAFPAYQGNYSPRTHLATQPLPVSCMSRANPWAGLSTLEPEASPACPHPAC